MLSFDRSCNSLHHRQGLLNGGMFRCALHRRRRQTVGVVSMGERSRAPETEEDAAKLSLRELEAWIRRAELRVSELKLSSSLRRSAMKRLVRLKAQRQKLYGVPAPRRGRF